MYQKMNYINHCIEDELTVKEAEHIAEFIDEQVHLLQYKVDHCRRLLEGAESDVVVLKSTWLTDERKIIMKKRYLKSLNFND